MDNQKINIYDPCTKERLLSGVYRNRSWIIKLKVIKNKDEVKEKYKSSALVSTRSKSKLNSNKVCQPSELEINEKENKIVKGLDLVSTGDNRKVHNVNFELKDGEFIEIKETSEENSDELESSETMKWHRRLGHVSRKYLLEFAKQNPNVLTKEDVNCENKIEECVVCLITKSVKLTLSSTRVRADKPLHIIHTDTMGPISPLSHPSG